MLFIATMLSMVFVACGDEKDEPTTPVSQKIESEHGEANDTYIVWDINLDQDSSSIYVYNAKFSERMPVTVNVRIDAPCVADKSKKVFTFTGTDITPYLLREGTPVPYESMPVTNLTSVVNTEKKTYSISFDCHGGHYDKTGSLK